MLNFIKHILKIIFTTIGIYISIIFLSMSLAPGVYVFINLYFFLLPSLGILLCILFNKHEGEKLKQKLCILFILNLITIFPLLFLPLSQPIIIFTLVGFIVLNLYFISEIKLKLLPIYLIVSLINFSLIITLPTVALCSKNVIFELEQTENCEYLYDEEIVRAPNYNEIHGHNTRYKVESSQMYTFDPITSLKQSGIGDMIGGFLVSYSVPTYYALTILYFVLIGSLSDLKEIIYRKYIPITIILCLLNTVNIAYLSALALNASEKGAFVFFFNIIYVYFSYLFILIPDILINLIFNKNIKS